MATPDQSLHPDKLESSVSLPERLCSTDVLFLSVSYSAQVDAQGRILPEYRTGLERTLSIFEDRQHKVFCAPREDGWKLNDMSPAEAFLLDVAEIEKSDVFIAFVGNRISDGIQLELGFALAKGKRIILLNQVDETLSYINKGMVESGRAELITFANQDDLAQKLEHLVETPS